MHKKVAKERERRKGEQHTRGQKDKANKEKGKRGGWTGEKRREHKEKGQPSETKTKTRTRMQAVQHFQTKATACSLSTSPHGQAMLGKTSHNWQTLAPSQKLLKGSILAASWQRLPHLPGVLGLEGEFHITPVPHLLHQPVAVLGEVSVQDMRDDAAF